MARTALTLLLPDVAAFTRALGRALHDHHATHGAPPGHQALLNTVARAAGWRNFQALKAQPGSMPEAAATPMASAAAAIEASPPPEAIEPDPAAEPKAPDAHAQRALGHFDADGRLTRWPVKFSVQKLVMWPLWMRFEAQRPYTEREVNAILQAAHTFGDHATLRRELINHRLLTRTPDCREYRKLNVRPEATARWVMSQWRQRFGPR
ncbi:MAG: DUF2087 domain-containing protein [Rubrivivax sp.]|jgi:hypothetical protein